ncbi:MAG: hypothetical protein COU33_02310 [Candidatus Magasanikbacteria bacterium CG10_big_fil_rev_8_21_14_0_10_43_6]|uniref:Uncharacterized protein n=1 Tax=Candidatus Magasanikbacteria bacterium CG10_big_fil_rev_8_21_14_0_10_43_6 TaxID=1974650 RepID=A0A2M6W1B8_9BACT|nr:MAG: hypothetical protein COU33_02310 [Candidatus Magasanikbacteria bacterium CG10_big_fil_rev_8_21_14_0_10_43_6]
MFEMFRKKSNEKTPDERERESGAEFEDLVNNLNNALNKRQEVKQEMDEANEEYVRRTNKVKE